jgi:para-aminobenzoate synthetase/4-amino-4-deoxychorismate lyase
MSSYSGDLQYGGLVVCRLPGSGNWGLFSNPVNIISCCNLENVTDSLRELETALASGLYAAGFISYEAGSAFDGAFPKRTVPDFPLLWFGVFKEAPVIFETHGKDLFAVPPELKAEVSADEYHDAVEDILTALRAGDIYQVNYTFRLRGGKTTGSFGLFEALMRKHPVPYAAYIDTGKQQIISMSPEIFLERNGNDIFSRPMKGTVKRHDDISIDLSHAEFLKNDTKNTAENLMIVDMARNDLGKVCCPGSIKVDPLFHVETYETLYQMTSTVHGKLKTDVTFTDILGACFPAASITGAPKVAAMKKIYELETSPRKIYTGSIGCIYPDGDFCLNVAIRTLLCSGEATELGIGGGIVYDSGKDSELEEAMLKSRFIHAAEPDFELLETMLLDKNKNITDLERHLARMENSARFFNFNFDLGKAFELIKSKTRLMPGNSRLRLLLDFRGNFRLRAYPLKNIGWGLEKAKIKLAEECVCSSNKFLRHKTTRRDFYNRQFKKATEAGLDEVIFVNERQEICEGAITNIFIQDDNGEWITPQLDCGLLPGVWRAENIDKLNAAEKVLYVEDLKKAKKILIGNSVRGGIEASLGI